MRLFFFFLVLDPLDTNQLLYILFVPLVFYIDTLLLNYLWLLFLLLLFLFCRFCRLRRLLRLHDEVHSVDLHECLSKAVEVRVLKTRHQLQLARPQLAIWCAYSATTAAVVAAFGRRRLREDAIWWGIADTRWSSRCCDYCACEDIRILTGELGLLKH